MSDGMNSYELSRNWFDFCFENPDLISPNHTALYFFCIEHCTRLGWKEKFGLPMEMAKEAIGIKNYRTYSKAFNDLIEFGFIELIQKSKNQYSSNIIAIVKNAKAHTKATTKALDKALIKHSQKQSQSTVGVNKQETRNNLNNKQKTIVFPFDSDEFKNMWSNWKEYKEKEFKFKYASAQSEQATLSKLSNLSKNNEEAAILIMLQSMENGWKGLFELKNNFKQKANIKDIYELAKEKYGN